MNNIRKLIVSSSRFVFVLLILLLAFVYAMFQGGQVSWTIFYMVLPFASYSLLLFFYPLQHITAERIVQTSNAYTGGKLSVRLLLKRPYRFPLLYTIVSERWRDGQKTFLKEQRPTRVFIFGFRKVLDWRYEIEQLPRGEHTFEGVEVEVVDFFGWMRKSQFIPVKSTILVYPKTTDIHLLPVNGHKDGGSAIALFNRMKNTTIATGLRDYQAGDRMTWVHWKSFARTQKLMSKEFEDRRVQEMTLLLDSRPSDMFEAQVELTASILKKGFQQFGNIGLLSTDREGQPFPNILTEEQYRQAFIHLANVQPTEDAAFWLAKRYGNVFRQAGTPIIITGSPDERFLESVASCVHNPRAIICFAVLPSDHATRTRILADIRQARKRGIVVHAMTQERFGSAFEEVTRL